MPNSFSLGFYYEKFVKDQLASGRYNNASEVVRDALRMMDEREQRLAAFDAAIDRGIQDMEAGRVIDADEVFARLEAKYARMAEDRGKS